MAERPKAVVLKTTERKLRGFESLSLRQLSFAYQCQEPLPSFMLRIHLSS